MNHEHIIEKVNSFFPNIILEWRDFVSYIFLFRARLYNSDEYIIMNDQDFQVEINTNNKFQLYDIRTGKTLQVALNEVIKIIKMKTIFHNFI